MTTRIISEDALLHLATREAPGMCVCMRVSLQDSCRWVPADGEQVSGFRASLSREDPPSLVALASLALLSLSLSGPPLTLSLDPPPDNLCDFMHEIYHSKPDFLSLSLSSLDRHPTPCAVWVRVCVLKTAGEEGAYVAQETLRGREALRVHGIRFAV